MYSARRNIIGKSEGIRRKGKLKKKYDMKITICPWCGADVKVKHGKLGFFQGCTDWPRCKFTAKMYYVEGLEMKKNGE